MASTVAASDSTARSASTLRISGWSIRSLPKAARWRAWWMACSTAVRMPAVGAQHAVQARVADHLDDRRHAAAGLADELAPHAVQLDLRAGVGPVAELVLQALDADRVALAVGQQARHGEARWGGWGPIPSGPASGTGRSSARCRTTCGRRAGSRRRRPRAAVVMLARTSEPPCFSVMAMPTIAPGLSRSQRAVVDRAGDARLPGGGQLRAWRAARARRCRSSRSGSRGRARRATAS